METTVLNLIGRYKLLSHGIIIQGNKFIPTSEYLRGELIYSSDGFLSVIIFFKDTFLKDPPSSEKDFLAYSGQYEIVSASKIVHKISICSQGKRDNSEEIRNYRIFEDNLILSSPLADNRLFEATWQKITI